MSRRKRTSASALLSSIADRCRADRQTSITYDPSLHILMGMTEDEAEAIRSFVGDLLARRAAPMAPSNEVTQ